MFKHERKNRNEYTLGMLTFIYSFVLQTIFFFFFLLSEKRYTNSAVVSSQAELLEGVCVFFHYSVAE